MRHRSERVGQILLPSVEREKLCSSGGRAVVVLGEENDGQRGVRSQKPDVRRRRGGHAVHDIVRAEGPRGGRQRLTEATSGVADHGDALKNAGDRIGEVGDAVSIVGEVGRAVHERRGAGPLGRDLKRAVVSLRRAHDLVRRVARRSQVSGRDGDVQIQLRRQALEHVQEHRHLERELLLDLGAR